MPSQQHSRDSEEEKSTDSTLTTLFPGQKKRVSHFVAKGNVSFFQCFCFSRPIISQSGPAAGISEVARYIKCTVSHRTTVNHLTTCRLSLMLIFDWDMEK